MPSCSPGTVLVSGLGAAAVPGADTWKRQREQTGALPGAAGAAKEGVNTSPQLPGALPPCTCASLMNRHGPQMCGGSSDSQDEALHGAGGLAPTKQWDFLPPVGQLPGGDRSSPAVITLPCCVICRFLEHDFVLSSCRDVT